MWMVRGRTVQFMGDLECVDWTVYHNLIDKEYYSAQEAMAVAYKLPTADKTSLSVSNMLLGALASLQEHVVEEEPKQPKLNILRRILWNH